MLTRRMVAASALGLVAAGCSAQSGAQVVHLIVGFPPGGTTDVIARLLAERLRLPNAATLIVENRPGATGRLAVEHVKNAEPDGSVLLLTPEGPIAVFPHSHRKLSYDPLRDLTPIAPVARSTLVLNIGPAVPQTIQWLSDFLEWCKTNRGRATFATFPGSPSHFAGFMLANAAGAEIVQVPYRGGAQAVQDLLGGHVAAYISLIPDTAALVSSGQLRALAVTASQRSRFLPGVPTMRELGHDVLVEAWLGLFAPANLPAESVRALSRAIAEALKSGDMDQQLAKLGADPMFQAPEEFAAIIRADIERWGHIVRASGFKAD